MSKNAGNVMLLLFVVVLFGLAGCGGGSSGDSSSDTQTPQITAKDAVTMSAPYDLAVAGESYQEQLTASSSDSTLTIVSYKIAESSTTAKVSGLLQKVVNAVTGTTLPSIDANGTLTWTPTDADMGVRIFDVTAITNNGTEKTIAISIEVAKRISLIQKTVGNEGGTFTDTNGEYTLVISSNAMEAGKTAITASISVVRRADGREVMREEVDGVDPDISYNLIRPVVAAPNISNSTTAVVQKTSAKGVMAAPTAIDGFNNIWQYKGFSDTGMPFLADKNGSETIAVLESNCTDNAFKKNDCDGKQGVIFVHGFTQGNGLGGDGTFGKTNEFVSSLDPNVKQFHFRWRTNSRFEEQASYFSQAVARVGYLTGNKPVVVAHSFGGVLVSTYLTGLAKDFGGGRSNKMVPSAVPYHNDIKSVITVGSPLSGTASRGNSIYTNTVKTDPYFLIDGADRADALIGNCGQISCAETGAGGRLGSAYRWYGNEPSNQFALPALSGRRSAYKSKGVDLKQPGSVINALQTKWRSPQNLPPMRILVGAKANIMGAGLAYKDNDKSYLGDGLISVTGQAVLPEHFVGSGYDIRASFNGWWDTPTAANVPSYIKYYFMALNKEGTYTGFSHTSMHGWLASNYYEVNLVNSDGTLDGMRMHPFAINLKEVVQGAVRSKEGYPGLTLSITNLKGRVQEKTRAAKIAAKTSSASATASSGPPFPYAFMVNKVMSNGELQSIYRKDGFTDATGQINLNIEVLAQLEETVPTTDLRITAVFGNSATHVPKNIEIDEWRDLLDLGTIELERRDALPTQVSFSGSVVDNSATSTPLAGATIKLKIGDNIAQQAFANIADSTTTRILTTGATGSFATTGLLPGRYTALIIKSGYMTKRQTLDIPDAGLSGQKFVLQSSASTTGTSLTLYGQPGNGSPTIPGTDIKSVVFSSDSNYLYWRMELFGTPNTMISTDFNNGYSVGIIKSDGSTFDSRIIYNGGQWVNVLMINKGSWGVNPVITTTALFGKIPISLLGESDLSKFKSVSAYVYLGNEVATRGI